MKDCFDLHGKTALITGASSGLGAEFARALAYRGANVAILARRKEKLEAVAAEIEALGAKACPIQCDVTDEAQIENAVAKAVEEFGTIDILINNAGTCDVVNTDEITMEKWNKVVDVNLDAVVFTTKHVVPYMKKQNSGRIISISSMYGLRASVTGNIPAYWASKGAIVQLTRGWAFEFAPWNITVNAIAPGFFLTELMPGTEENYKELTEALIPLKRIARPEEMDGLITLLASDGASYITGQTIAIDGGKTAI